MRNRRKLFSLISLMLIMVMAFAGCSSKPAPTTDANKKIEIKFGSTAQNNLAGGIANKWAVDQVNTKSNGRINISYHGQSTIGNDGDLIQQVMAGNIQMADFSIGAFSQYSPLLETLQLPFLITSYEEELDAFNSPEWKALVAKLEKQLDVKILGFHEHGLRHFATVKKPVNTIADIKGVKIRVAPSVIIQKAMGLIGANPMTITYGEVVSALQNKTIDGEEINITSAGSQKHYDVIKYISEVGFYPYPGPTVVNGKFWRSLSAEDQKLIADIWAESETKDIKEWVPQTENTFRKECADNGVKFNKVEDLQPFKDAVAPLYKEYSDKDPLIKAFIDKYSQK